MQGIVMSPRWTKDERYVVSVYEMAMLNNDLETVLDRYEAGARVGISPKAVDAICHLLMQANFIKKVDKTAIKLTKNGEELALRLQRE
jgi:hypothetical protein